jgi:hypothetical protein
MKRAFSSSRAVIVAGLVQVSIVRFQNEQIILPQNGHPVNQNRKELPVPLFAKRAFEAAEPCKSSPAPR